MKIGIVGAGPAGLATAYGLRTAPIEVTVFEKSRGFGGRAATRGRDGHRYDHGAPFFSAPTERVRRLVTGHLPTKGLIDLSSLQIWGFDTEGTIVPNGAQGPSPRWTYRAGVSTIGKLLAQQSQAVIRRNCRIAGISEEGGGWGLIMKGGSTSERYDALVLTPPAPQAARLLETARNVGGRAITRLWGAVREVQYASQFAYIFAFGQQQTRPDSLLGLRATEDQHPISWVGFEDAKPGHVRSGHSLIVVHTSPSWTAGRVDSDPASYVPEIRTELRDLLERDLPDPVWVDTQRWRYSVPEGRVDPKRRSVGQEAGVFLGGDAVEGRGSVGAALQTGISTADRLLEKC